MCDVCASVDTYVHIFSLIKVILLERFFHIMVWDECNIIYLTVQSFSVGFLHGLIGIKHVKTKSGCIYIYIYI